MVAPSEDPSADALAGASALPDLDGEDTVPTAAPLRRAVPWGSVALIVLYVLGAGAYLGVSYYLSDDYAVGRDLAAGDALLGDDRGRGVTTPDLARAASHYLDALLVDPDLGGAHEKLKSIKWRYQERGEAFPRDLQMRWAAVAARARAGRTSGSILDALPVTADERFGLSRARDTLTGRLYWVGTGLFLLLAWTGFRWWRRAAAEDDPRPDEGDRGSALY